MIEKKNSLSTFFMEFFMGGIALAVAKTLTNPTELIKLKVQQMNQMAMYEYTKKLEKALYAQQPAKIGVKDCLKQIIQEDGIMGLFRGSRHQIRIRWLSEARNFALKDLLKRLFSKNKQKDGFWVFFGTNLTSGALAGALSLGFVHWLTESRNRFNRDLKNARKGNQKMYKSLFDVYKKTWAEQGIAGFFRGFTIDCISNMVYRGLYFGLFDTLKSEFPKILQNNFLADFLFGWNVTILANFTTYPINTVRRRLLMMEAKDQVILKAFECTKQILRNESWRAFFIGSSHIVARSMTGGLALAVYEKLQLFMFKSVNEQSF